MLKNILYDFLLVIARHGVPIGDKIVRKFTLPGVCFATRAKTV